MTISDLLALATEGLTTPSLEVCRALAQGVMDRLGEESPCGWGFECPEVCREEDMQCRPKPDGEISAGCAGLAPPTPTAWLACCSPPPTRHGPRMRGGESNA